MTTDRLQQLQALEQVLQGLFASIDSLTEALRAMTKTVTREEAVYMAKTYDQRNLPPTSKTFNA